MTFKDFRTWRETNVNTPEMEMSGCDVLEERVLRQHFTVAAR